MLTIKEICAQTGITLHTFHFWRRDGSKLLPNPVAVEKTTFLFDDSIVERIRFIKEQRAAGKKLREIEDFFESYHSLAKGARTAELVAKLETLETAFKRDMYSYKLRIERLFRDFQEMMTESHASAFLAALAAKGLTCSDKPSSGEVLPPPPAEINIPEVESEETAATE